MTLTGRPEVGMEELEKERLVALGDEYVISMRKISAWSCMDSEGELEREC